MKNCKKCGTIKSITQFYKTNNTKDGYMGECIECHKETVSDNYKKLNQTKSGIMQTLWNSLNERPDKFDINLLNRKMFDWFFKRESKNFDDLFNNYVDSDYDKWMKPSIDRIDCTQGYFIANMQLITWKENWEKCHEETKKCVFVYDKLGNLEIFKSQTELSEKTGISLTIINKCLDNNYLTKKTNIYKESLYSRTKLNNEEIKMSYENELIDVKRSRNTKAKYFLYENGILKESFSILKEVADYLELSISTIYDRLDKVVAGLLLTKENNPDELLKKSYKYLVYKDSKLENNFNTISDVSKFINVNPAKVSTYKDSYKELNGFIVLTKEIDLTKEIKKDVKYTVYNESEENNFKTLKDAADFLNITINKFYGLKKSGKELNGYFVKDVKN